MEKTGTPNRKMELIKFIGINTGLITDLIQIFNPSDPDFDTLTQVLKLYQENEVYRNELEEIMNKEFSALTWEFIKYKQTIERGQI